MVRVMREAVVLAAGYGKGLEPLTQTRHKVLTPIIDKPLIQVQLEMLKEIGISRVILVVNYLRGQVEEFLSKYAETAEIDYIVIDQGKPLGTAHALSKALPYIKGEIFLLIYGDILTDKESLKAVVKASPSIGVARVPNPSDYGVVLVEGGTLKKIIEKPRNPPTNLVNSGVYALPRDIGEFLDKVELSERGEMELTDALTQYCLTHSLKVVQINNWLDIGRPWSVLEANKLMMRNLRKSIIKGSVEQDVKIHGPVVVEEGASLKSGTYIIGPSYIGKNTDIGPNAFLRPYSVVLEGSRVGFNVEVKESIIMEGAHVSHQAYVGDSIVGEGSNLGAGTILANLRFDGRPVPINIKGKRIVSGRRKLGAIIGGHVKTGVNVSTYPGVKIGAYSWINPGVVVKRDVPPCIHLVTQDEFKEIRGECGVDLSVWRPLSTRP